MTKVPYQRLQTSGNTLVAARGSSIDIFDLANGSYLSTWSTVPKSTIPTSAPVTQESSSPPAKRRKVSDGETLETAPPVEMEQTTQPNGNNNEKSAKEKKKQQQQKSRAESAASGFENPAVICMTATDDGKYVIIVTAEDKSIRVLENIEDEGGSRTLKQISIRQMAKRPCAITLSSDNQTIISADKFGDVYTLPLIPLPEDRSSATSKTATPEPSKPWQPAANEFTIHSKRNLNALEQQRRHKTQPNAAERTNFAGTLILGHVSMLTDLIWGRLDGKEYIITADRDEHIRVTRGGGQTYVIERFCLGHEDIVTRLCIPSSRPGLLISGGGDDEIFTWDWKNGVLLSRTNLLEHVTTFLQAAAGHGSETLVADSAGIVVSTINHIPVIGGSGSKDIVAVTVEGVPALFVFHLNDEASVGLQYAQSVPLPGNPLDVLIHSSVREEASTKLVVSVDHVHEAGSRHKRRSDSFARRSLVALELQVNSIQETTKIEFENSFGGEEESFVDPAKLSLLLYPLESLKKREGEDKED